MADHLETAMLLERLERELLTPAIRHNPERVRELLAPDFREFGSSGRIFTRATILEALAAEPPVVLTLIGFRCDRLADDCFLVTYVSHRESESGVTMANRSSVWVLHDQRWQLLFHQGTPAAQIL